MANPIIVLVFGTFDTLHRGHLYFLSEASALGDKLVVVVARDKNVEFIKGVKPYHSESERLQLVRGTRIAAKVMLGNIRNKFNILEKLKPDIIALGFDQHAPISKIKKILPQVKIIRLSAHFPEKYKSSIIKQNINK